MTQLPVFLALASDSKGSSSPLRCNFSVSGQVKTCCKQKEHTKDISVLDFYETLNYLKLLEIQVRKCRQITFAVIDILKQKKKGMDNKKSKIKQHISN